MIYQVAMQAQKAMEALSLYQYLSSHGIQILLVKGLIRCSLNPNADYRKSVDEDFLILPDQFAAAVFRIAGNYFTFSPEKACFLEEWLSMAVDERMLLEENKNNRKNFFETV